MAATPKPVRKAQKEVISYNKKVIKKSSPKAAAKEMLKEHKKVTMKDKKSFKARGMK